MADSKCFWGHRIRFAKRARRECRRLHIRQELDAISHFVRFEHRGDQLQVANGLTNGDSQLVGVDNTGKVPTVFKPSVRQR